jgi:hypothetical protein
MPTRRIAQSNSTHTFEAIKRNNHDIPGAHFEMGVQCFCFSKSKTQAMRWFGEVNCEFEPIET